MLSTNILSMAALDLQSSLCATDCVLLIMRIVVLCLLVAVGQSGQLPLRYVTLRYATLRYVTLRYATLHVFGS
jgi:hypothetical protein